MSHIKMWRSIICLLAAISAVTIASGAQDDKCRCSDCKNDPSCSCCPGQVLKGTIKMQGDKYTFVNDKYEKALTVTNPEALKGKEGHHVQITGHVSADNTSIKVTSMKMIKDGSQMKDDSKQDH